MAISILVAKLIRKLRPEEKVNLAVSMTDVCTRICAEGIRDRNVSLKEKHIIEKVRERIIRKKPRHFEV